MSFDICVLVRSQTSTSLNPFRSRRCLSTELARMVFFGDVKSKSLSSRAMSFDYGEGEDAVERFVSQSLSIRAMSFDENQKAQLSAVTGSQSLSIRAMSFDEKPKAKFWLNIGLSQSLSSRAMSFD